MVLVDCKGPAEGTRCLDAHPKMNDNIKAGKGTARNIAPVQMPRYRDECVTGDGP